MGEGLGNLFGRGKGSGCSHTTSVCSQTMSNSLHACSCQVMFWTSIADDVVERGPRFHSECFVGGCRVVLEEAESELTGGISIEDVTLQEPGEADSVVRRMVFTSNRNLVQSEAALVPSQTTATTAASQSLNADSPAAVGKKGKHKRGKAKNQSKASSPGSSEGMVIDHSVLACDYHKGMIAGLSLIQPLVSITKQTTDAALGSSQQRQQQPQPSESLQQHSQQQQQGRDDVASQSSQRRRQPGVMVVGLGGGGLPVYLNQFCSMNVHVVELDPVVVELARRHFGFQDSSSLQVCFS